MKTNLLAAGLILAWLVTPESLVITGKVAGMSGAAVTGVLFVGFIISAIAAFILFHGYLRKAGHNDEISPLKNTIGSVSSHTLQLCGRIPTLLFVSTGMLVSAGFAFNEIFLYWFPNFLFASLILFLIAGVNAFGEKTALTFQAGCVLLTFAALATLLIMALFGDTPEILTHLDSAGRTSQLPAFAYCLVFLSFIGFDFHRDQQHNGIVFFALFSGFLLLAGWSFVAVRYVDSTSLLHSSISYMHVARAVAGDTGRYVMGVAVISGVAAGVNGLFIVGKRSVHSFIHGGPQSKKINVEWLYGFIFAVIIEAMMMTGYAGEKILETQIKAAVFLWLAYLAARIFAAGWAVGGARRWYLVVSCVIGISVLFIMAYLIMNEPMKLYILIFCAVIVAVTMLASAIWNRLGVNNSLKS